MEKGSTYATGSVDRSLAVIEALALSPESLRLSEIAQRLDMPKSATHRILTALVENGWARQSVESECYTLTLRMALIGQRQLRNMQVSDLKQPILAELAERTCELVRLTAVEKGRLIWIGSARGRRSGLVFEPDMSAQIVPHATANGKIWLAQLDCEQAVRIALGAGLGDEGRHPQAAIRTIDALLAELEETRARGYGRARGEAEEGVGAVAVAVERDGAVVGTVSVAAPLTRMSDERVREIVPQLQRAAANLSIAW